MISRSTTLPLLLILSVAGLSTVLAETGLEAKQKILDSFIQNCSLYCTEKYSAWNDVNDESACQRGCQYYHILYITLPYEVRRFHMYRAMNECTNIACPNAYYDGHLSSVCSQACIEMHDMHTTEKETGFFEGRPIIHYYNFDWILMDADEFGTVIDEGNPNWTMLGQHVNRRMLPRPTQERFSWTYVCAVSFFFFLMVCYTYWMSKKGDKEIERKRVALADQSCV